MMTEFVTTDTNVFYCDCNPDCLEKFKLPVEAGNMLKSDTALILLINNHKLPKTVEVVKRGKGWKICRLK